MTLSQFWYKLAFLRGKKVTILLRIEFKSHNSNFSFRIMSLNFTIMTFFSEL